MHKTIRTLPAALITFVLCVTAHATAAAQSTAEFNLPAQPLADSLRAVAGQTNSNILFDRSLVQGISARPLKAQLSVEEALRALLKGTGLTYRNSDDKTVMIVSERTNAGTSLSRDGRGAEGEGAILAQAMQRIEKAEGPGPEERRSDAASEGYVKPESEPHSGIPEILVEGSRILNMDIARSRDDIQPYVVFDKQTIERSGARNVEEFLRQRMTASTTNDSASQSNTFQGSGSAMALRGLGADETLILIDGRRAAGASTGGGSLAQPSINGIPLSAIDRIEVLPTTASGIYGGSATGGVINIILRRDYTGVEARAIYENTFDSDFAQGQIDLSAGLSLEGGRTSIMAAGSYGARGDLLLGERNFVQRYRSHILATNPSTIFGSTLPPLGATTNIRCNSCNAANPFLTLKGSNVSLGSNITFIPAGYAGVGSDAGAALITNAGQYNLDLAQTAQANGARLTLYNPPATRSFLGAVRREFLPWLDSFLELTASESKTDALASGASSFIVQPGPGNPFNQAVRVATPAFGADAPLTTTSTNYRMAGGFIFELPARWSASFDYTWGLSRFSMRSEGSGAFDSTAATAGIISGALNVFRDTNSFPIDFSPFLLAPSTGGPTETTLGNLALRSAGPLPVRLPGGALTVSMLLERRKEKIADSVQHLTQFNATSFFPKRSQAADSAYAELLAPIISENNHIRGIDLLELQVAGRWDEYETRSANQVSLVGGIPTTAITHFTNNVSSVDPTIGLRYRPVPDVMFRTSYGTGFRPPAVQEVTGGTPGGTFVPSNVRDPLRGNELLGAVFTIFGTNPDLQPENSESWSAGLVLTPRFIPGFRLSVDWTRIGKTDAILGLSPTSSQLDLNTMISLSPERITRSTDPATFGAFGVGPIVGINHSLINFASADVEAFDIALAYELQTARFGDFTFSGDATNLVHNQTQVADGYPTIELAGVASDIRGGNVKWRANASFIWDYGNWTTAWTTRFFDSYYLNQDHAIVPNQGSSTIPSQSYHDFFVGYRFAIAGILEDAEAHLGIKNILDEAPPIDVSAFNFFSAFGDAQGAAYYISIKNAF